MSRYTLLTLLQLSFLKKKTSWPRFKHQTWSRHRLELGYNQFAHGSMCRHVRISHPPSRAAAALDWLCDWDTNQILGANTLSANICTADVCCVQVDESSRQREEINSLLAQVRQCHNANIFPINKQIFSPLSRCATFRSGCRPTATRTMTSLPTSGCIRYLLFMFTGFSWSCKVYG